VDATSSGPAGQPAPGGLRRPFLLGFVLGFLVLVPAAVLGLLFVAFERVQPWLTPGALLLRPLSDAMAGWPGAVNLLLGSVANGLVLGLVAAGLVAAWRASGSGG
jgi:hypothetical protein